MLSDGPVLSSEATLFRSHAACWSSCDRDGLARLRARLGLDR
jgi:hypothetical protein